MKKICAKCGCNHRLEKHHLNPKVHYGQSVRVVLCHKHHRELEYFIQKDEGFKNGRRVKRDKQFYLDKLICFLQGASY